MSPILYRLNMAQVLINRGQYATESINGLHLFDAATSIGPVDIAAIALTIGLFGVGNGQARLAVTLLGAKRRGPDWTGPPLQVADAVRHGAGPVAH